MRGRAEPHGAIVARLTRAIASSRGARAVAKPYLPALQGAVQVLTLSPAVAPNVPQAQRPLQPAVLEPSAPPKVPAGHAYCVAEQEPARQ